MTVRGELWWANLRAPLGSEPGYRRPVVIVQSDAWNRSRIQTVIVAALTSNLDRANDPGNVLVRSAESGLDKHSVINVTQVFVADRSSLEKRIGVLPSAIMERVDDGLRRVLAL